MARFRLRSRSQVVERCQALRTDVAAALDRLPSHEPAVVDAVWRGEALGTLLWSLNLLELPPYDRPFDTDEVVNANAAAGELRDADELELERDSARLWHWRARTTELQQSGVLQLPARYASFDQLIAATAMRGHDEGLLPVPIRGDFRAYGKVYRHLSPEQHAEAHSIAAERHHALNWLAGEGTSWDDVPLDT
ncbi:MAG TPA: hypothetical protein VFJ78_10095 [Gaiellaceae bacterium]|jgi:hypothetical protein|nr:hypothetical protein [Gaiellaceae bacterium]